MILRNNFKNKVRTSMWAAKQERCWGKFDRSLKSLQVRAGQKTKRTAPASQTEGCILRRLHISAATSSNVAEGHLSRKDHWKASFVSHASFSRNWRMHGMYPSQPSFTHNPLYTFQFTKINCIEMSEFIMKCYYEE